MTEQLRQQALSKEHAAKDLGGAALENQIRKNRFRWLREYLTEAGDEPRRRVRLAKWMHPDQESGRIADCEAWRQACHRDGWSGNCRDFVAEPFVGWNEASNTSASLSYLLGTSFRQLPTNERKRLDIIPVDSVCRA